MSKKTIALLALAGVAVSVGLLLGVIPVHSLLKATFGTLKVVIATIIILDLAILAAPLLGCFGLMFMSMLIFINLMLIGFMFPLLFPVVVLFLMFRAFRPGVRKGPSAAAVNSFDGRVESTY
jgi:hypothetical protein